MKSSRDMDYCTKRCLETKIMRTNQKGVELAIIGPIGMIVTKKGKEVETVIDMECSLVDMVMMSNKAKTMD